MTLTLAKVGPKQLITEIVVVNSNADFFTLRKDHHNITGINPEPQVGWFWNGFVFAATMPALDSVAVKARSSQTLTNATGALLMQGFPSSALGASHNYPSKITDQNNLSTACQAASIALAGSTTSFSAGLWCSIENVWTLTQHTASQVQQVMSDWVTYREAQQQALVTAIAAL